MIPFKNRKVLVTAAIVVGSFAGSALVASAVTNGNSSTTLPTPTPSNAATQAGLPPVDGQADGGSRDHQPGDRMTREQHEAAEAADGTDAKLLAQAKITPDQAEAAALAVAPGTAGVPDIHDRDGVLTYRVDVTTATGNTEVTVDATTGAATIDTGHDFGGGPGGPGDGDGHGHGFGGRHGVNDNDADDAVADGSSGTGQVLPGFPDPSSPAPSVATPSVATPSSVTPSVATPSSVTTAV
jgi:Peptidase propeptide and YPEB domain